MPTDLTRVVYAGRHLLDHQIVSIHGEMIGKVDDLEITDGAPGEPATVAGLLTGQIAYGPRLGGFLGTWIRTTAARLRGLAGPEPRRLDLALVRSIGHTVVLNVPASETPSPDLEHWLSEHFISRLPGS